MTCPRRLEPHVRRRAATAPILVLTGPRQSGKTTLCRAIFDDRPYVTCESADVREFVERDPRGFLARHSGGAVLDEVQRAPSILSYLQEEVDARPQAGRFIVTGSQNLSLLSQVSQSLAGRAALLHLLPFSLAEARALHATRDLETELLLGGYPRIRDLGLDPYEWLGDYIATYVERDVRQLVNIGDLRTFRIFLGLCAGRSGQLVNLAQLGADAGIDAKTAKAWMSALEASFLIKIVSPLHRNLDKRLTRTPKLFFLDSGLLCRLLEIRTVEQLRTHPLRGAIFETFVASELLKAGLHAGQSDTLWFYRDQGGTEVDFVIASAARLAAIEAKAGATIASDFFSGLHRMMRIWKDARLHEVIEPYVVYGGEEAREQEGVRVVPWSGIEDGVGGAAVGG